MCRQKRILNQFLGTGNEPVASWSIQCRASESFFLPVALIGFYSCGFPADQMGANTELGKYRALMDTNGLIFILFVDFIVPNLVFLLFSVQEKQRYSAQESNDNEEVSSFCDFLPELFYLLWNFHHLLWVLNIPNSGI